MQMNLYTKKWSVCTEHRDWLMADSSPWEQDGAFLNISNAYTKLTLESIKYNQVELTPTDISVQVVDCKSKIQVLALTTTIAIAPVMSQ